MTESSQAPRWVARTLIAFVLLAPMVVPPAAAVDIFSRNSEIDLLLRDLRRIKGLQVTVEVRFVTVADEFLERVGVDFSGSVDGRVTKRGQPVENAKVILEAYKVRDDNDPARRVMTRTGRQTVSTDSSGRFDLPIRQLVSPEVRKEILEGKVDALVVEATGKNGKRIDHIHLRAETALGGLVP